MHIKMYLKIKLIKFEDVHLKIITFNITHDNCKINSEMLRQACLYKA